MALKYRVVYEDYSRYKKGNVLKIILTFLLPILLCAAFMLYQQHTGKQTSFWEFLLPGNPTVTAEAFHQLSDAMSRGELLSDALDSFCETVMNGQ